MSDTADDASDSPNTFDILAAAEQVAKPAFVTAYGEAALRQHTYWFADVYTARRALLLSQLFSDRDGEQGWIARVVGTHPLYRLDRRFLPRTRHVLAQKAGAFDFTAVRAGDVLQCHHHTRSADCDMYLRVVSITDGCLTAEPLVEKDIATLYHRGRL